MPVKPSEKEEAYFARQAFERQQKLEEESYKKLKATEKRKLKELHYMHCPKCGMDLIEIDYHHIKVDKCSGCEGIWLDAGELEEVSHLDKSTMTRFLSVFKK